MIPYCLLTLLALAPSRVEIREMVQRAEAAYENEQWDSASRGFADAYAVDPNPDYLFARAQAERFAGRCNVSVKLWDQYIAVEKSPDRVREAKVFRAYCEPQPTTDPTAPVVPRTTAPSAGDRAPRSTRSAGPWFRDPVGGVLVATGGVSTVIGASVLGLALSRDRKAASADTEGGYVGEKDAARTPHRAGIVVLSVGGALLVAGVVRWAIVASRSHDGDASRIGAAGRGGRASSQRGPARRVTFGLGRGLRF